MGGTQTKQTSKSNYQNYLSCIHPHLKAVNIVESSEGVLFELKIMVQPFLQLDNWLDRM